MIIRSKLFFFNATKFQQIIREELGELLQLVRFKLTLESEDRSLFRC